MPITPKCLSELFEAVSSGYIPIALNQRSSYILSGSLSIKEEVNSCFADISDLMKFMVETHWTVFFSAMVVNYFLIGRCPFYFKTGSIAFRGIKVKERYPQALLPGEYSYEKVITAGSVEPEHIFRMNGVMEQPKIYSISSQLFSGVNTSMVDVISSEMGYILDAWREHKIIMETAKTARARLLHPRRYIEYRPNNTIQKNDSQIAAYTDHLKTTDKNGYSLTKYEIIDLPNSSTSILPEDFSFCQHQHPVDFKLTETS